MCAVVVFGRRWGWQMHLQNCHLLFTHELKFHSNWYEICIIYVLYIHMWPWIFCFSFGLNVPLRVFLGSATASRTQLANFRWQTKLQPVVCSSYLNCALPVYRGSISLVASGKTISLTIRKQCNRSGVRAIQESPERRC